MSTSGARNTIIVSTDFSRASLAAASLGFALSTLLKARLVLLHVFRYTPQHRYVAPVEWMLKELRTRTQRKLNFLQARISSEGGYAEILLIEGREEPASAILKAAAKTANPVLVLGTHSRTGLDRFLLGSAAEAIVRHSEWPVITVGPRVAPYWERPLRRIVLATDLTERSMTALPMIRELWSPESRLIVVHVAHPDAMIDSSWERVIRERLVEVLALGESELNEQVEFRRVVHATVSRAIHELAVAEDADLVAIGIHPGTVLTEHAHPRTGFQIVMSAPCAVLSVCE